MIAIIGAGSWGTALSVVLGSKGTAVTLWCRREEIAKEINETRKNKQYLPDHEIPETVKATSNLSTIKDAEIVVFAVPSQFLRETAKEAKQHINTDTIMHVVKGIGAQTLKLPSQILKEELEVECSVLSGPNHAEEVAKGLPTATVIASETKEKASELCKIFTTKTFKAYPHDDVIGVEICGTMKNIIAIAIGVCDGLKLGDNAKGSILTFGLSEMSAVAKQFGAKRTTSFGLAGVGDLVTTCYSQHSRNRFVGEMLAKGKTIDEIKEEMNGMIAEGIKNTKSLYDITQKFGQEPPLITHAYKVLYENMDLRQAIDELINKI